MTPAYFFQQFAFGRAFLTLVQDPGRTESIFRMSELARKQKDHPSLKLILDHALASDDFRRLWEEKYLPSKPDIENLAHLPDGTLGFEYAQHLIRNNLKPDFYPEIEPDSPLTYLILRLRQTHDLWHVLTEYNTSVGDELALQGFTLAQTQAGIPAVILAGGILHILKKNPTQLMPTFDKIIEGYQRGKQARFFPGITWEGLWGEKITSLRNQFLPKTSQPLDRLNEPMSLDL